MTVSTWRDRRGVTVGDALVVLALLSLAFAVAYPRVTSAVFGQVVDAAVYDVETVRGAAIAYHQETGTWPAEAPPGTIPAELIPALPDGFSPTWSEYTLDWSLWELVELRGDEPEAEAPNFTPVPGVRPPEPPALEEPERPVVHRMAGISLATERPELLAALLARFGEENSFVHGSVWTLILREDAEGN